MEQTLKEYLEKTESDYINIYCYEVFDIEAFKKSGEWIFKDLQSGESIDQSVVNDLLNNHFIVGDYGNNIIQVARKVEIDIDTVINNQLLDIRDMAKYSNFNLSGKSQKQKEKIHDELQKIQDKLYKLTH